MTRTLIERRVSLDATLFYQGILRYRPPLRDELLAFQHAAISNAPWVARAFDALHGWVDTRLRADVARILPPRTERIDTSFAHASH